MKCWLVLSGCVLACGGGREDEPSLGGAPRHPIPGCESIDAAPCDPTNTACRERLFALAACLRGQTASDPPAVTLITEDEFRANLEQAFAEEPTCPEPDRHGIALAQLGLLDAADLTPAARIADLAGFVYGLYRWDTKDILLIEHGSGFVPESVSPLLVHEFVHALQDRDVDLEAIERAAESDDAYWAVDAIIEGEATLHEARFAASILGLDPAEVDWHRHFENGLVYSEKKVFEASSPYLESFHRFPYRWGARYLDFVWAEKGPAAVRALLTTPPAATLPFLLSTQGAVDAGEPLELPPGPSPPSELVPAVAAQGCVGNPKSLGAWGLFLFLGAGTRDESELESARAVARAWRGDELSVYASTILPNATALVWRIAFDDEANAQSAAALAGLAVGAGAVRAHGTTLLVAVADSSLDLDWAR